MVSNKAIKGVIFDFDGTLFDLEVDWRLLNKTLNEKFGIKSLTNPFPDNIKNDVIDAIGVFEKKGIEQGVSLVDSQDVLEKLSKEYIIAVTSRNNRATVKDGLKKMGFKKPIEVVGREDVTLPKPHPEALKLTLDKIGLQPGQVVVVGDTTHDLEAAKILGIICIIVKNQKLAFQPKGADFYIDSLAGLPQLMTSLNNERNR